MADCAAKGDEFMKQGQKKVKSFGFFGSKWEEAADLFEKAANNYKLAKCWMECCEAYERLSECHMKLESQYEAATSLVEGAKAAARANPAKSNQLLQRAVGMYTDMGRLNMAARQLKDIGENNEKAGLKAEAIAFYEKAADLFEAEKEGSSEATKCKLKIAEFQADLGKFREAAALFEAVAKLAVENNLLKYSARGYLLNAGICLLCYANVEELSRKMDSYRDIDLQFERSREETLLEALVEAFRQQDEKMFATSLAEFDGVTRLDAWKTRILLEGKKRISDMELGVGGGARGRGGGSDRDDVSDNDSDDLL
ncbi:MAG: hypothetical protein WDW38_002510 [Sanguina aurantia]